MSSSQLLCELVQ